MTDQTVDYFGLQDQPKLYNSFRPEYPDNLINFVIAKTMSRHNLSGKFLDSFQTNGKCALDLACGTGLFTRKLSSKFEKVYGTDTSDGQIEEARRSNSCSNVSYSRFHLTFLFIYLAFQTICEMGKSYAFLLRHFWPINWTGF